MIDSLFKKIPPGTIVRKLVLPLVFAFVFVGYAQNPSQIQSSVQLLQQHMMEEGLHVPDIKALEPGTVSPDDLPALKKSIDAAMERKDAKTPGSGEKTAESSGDDSDDFENDDGFLQRGVEAEDISSTVYQRIIRGDVINPDDILKSIEPFGLSVFSRQRGQYGEPTDHISMPANYTVVPGDEIVVSLWGRINEDRHLTVSRDGSVSIPRIGQLPVAGMPFSVVQKNLTERLQSIEGVQASVTMGRLRTIPVFVVGEVFSPGRYMVNALSGVTNVLFAAGGVTSRGSLRTIELRRNGKLVASLDFYEFLLSGNNFGDIRLQAGDVLFVPVIKNMAAVAGNVRRSALYEFKEKTSLKDVISIAGGFTPAAWTNRIQIDRFTGNNHQVVLDIETSSPEQLPDFQIEDGDIIRIFQILDRDINAVYLYGNVKRPGKYEYKEAMRVSDLIAGYKNLLPETYLEYAAIRRMEAPFYTEYIISFALGEALVERGSAADIVLEASDKIIVYHRDYFEPDRTVSIAGAVTKPGRYRLLKNMRIKDLVLQAGGLKDASSTERGEIYRRTFTNDSVLVGKTLFSVDAVMADDTLHNLMLNRFDQVYIRDKRGWEEIRQVVLSGEVVFPGEYILLPGESLGELLSRAGGFTGKAYLEAAVFTRNAIKNVEARRNADYIRTLESNIARISAELASKQRIEEAQFLLNHQMSLLENLRELRPVGRVVIDLTDPSSYKEFLLEHGDTLYVPKLMSTVSVMGEVFNPSTFQHDRRKARAGYFISLAGGFKENSDKRNAYVIRANGTVVSGKGKRIYNYSMKPGDVVVVPQKIRLVSGYRVFMETVDAVYKVAMTAAVVITLVQKTN